MDFQRATSPRKLENYSFLWSEARLAIAALALFLGGVPPLIKFVPIPNGMAWSILTVCWIVSGLASAYLFYKWYDAGFMLFGTKAPMDKWAFVVLVISGINLGLAGIIKQNIGMNITSSGAVFWIVGLLYLVSAWHLRSRWLRHGKKLF